MSRTGLRSFGAACVCALLSPLFAQEAPKLPVKRVYLYKNGVGYFEHVGQVKDDQQVTVRFTSGQLDDVLKSLTVLDLGNGRITGITYGSSAPRERQLGDLRLPVGDGTNLSNFLGALRGARMEVRSGTFVITGRLLSIERKTRISGGATLEVDFLTLITDTGEVRTSELTPQFSVKLLDRGLTGQVDRYLDILASDRDAGLRQMVIATSGSGDRSLFVSYISEVPVWKSTYRLVLSSKRPPLLQGWAIVDNTVGEDWEKVELALVAGAPQSFLQNLSKPYFARRPVVGLPEAMAVTPQTYQATLHSGPPQIAGVITDPSGAVVAGATVKALDEVGQVIAEAVSDGSGRYQLSGLPPGPVRVTASMTGFHSTGARLNLASEADRVAQDFRLDVGESAERVDVTAASPRLQADASLAGRARGSRRSLPPPPKPSPAPAPLKLDVEDARLRTQAAAASQSLGDLFEYKLKEPITIRKNQSALVPIVQSGVIAEKVSVWNESSGISRPMRALWLTNSSGLTLDSGTFSVLEDEAFAGEGLIDSLRPNEKRLISYAVDLALNVNANTRSEHDRVTRVVIADGVMTQHMELREKKTYTFRNEDSTARSVLVEHPIRSGFRLRPGLEPAETTARYHRLRLQVKPKDTASLVVEETRPVESTIQISQITEDRIELYLRQKSVPAEAVAAFRKILALQSAANDLSDRLDEMDERREDIFKDQERLRENLKSLKGTPEEKALTQRYTQQLNEQETKLQSLQKESEVLRKRREEAEAEVKKAIQALALDARL
ncbi:MAG: carboxypeptidase regulatory-like domain-containing protein [Bryobacteraceae bacterium]|nr:carboxypeptidase regulatory-like domain-containing protein [Bryobacteraceae bacterium]